MSVYGGGQLVALLPHTSRRTCCCINLSLNIPSGGRGKTALEPQSLSSRPFSSPCVRFRYPLGFYMFGLTESANPERLDVGGLLFAKTARDLRQNKRVYRALLEAANT
ncbi:hypothetical protein Ddc_01711 [Ditylenchus destructor]|nr:hypothetical protein Ddc_01711 [Ditylenchus destructor]